MKITIGNAVVHLADIENAANYFVNMSRFVQLAHANRVVEAGELILKWLYLEGLPHGIEKQDKYYLNACLAAFKHGEAQIEDFTLA